MSEAKELLGALHKGAPYAYIWTPQGEKVENEDDGTFHWRPQTLWYSTSKGLAVPTLWQQSRDVFYGVHPTSVRRSEHQKAHNEDVGAISCLFADYDVPDGTTDKRAFRNRILQRCAVPPSAVVSSGGGYHLYWLLEQTLVLQDDATRERARLLQYAWAEHWQADGKVKDLARVLRLPGTFNRKPEYAPRYRAVTLEKLELSVTYAVDDLEKLVQATLQGVILRETQAQQAQAPQPVDVDDTELLERIRRSANGAKFERLWAGDCSDYGGDHSSADQGLCNILAFWTGRDEPRMDKLFRASGLFREKWDRAAYRQKTLRDAVASCRSVYDPQAHTRDDDEAVVQAVAFASHRAQTRPAQSAAARAASAFSGTTSTNTQQGTQNAGTSAASVANGSSQRSARGRGPQVDVPTLGDAWMRAHPDYMRAREKWHRYADGVWTEVDDDPVEKLFWDFLATRGIPATNKLVGNVMQYCRVTLYVDSDDLDANPDLINLTNGTWSLRADALLTHSPDRLLTTGLPFEYDPGALSPWWDRYVETTFVDEKGRPDTELAAFMQEAIGYSLTSDIGHHVMFWCFGQGANGKGILFHALEQLAGDGATPLNINILKREQYQLARLAGKRVALCAESESHTVVEDGLIKQIVAGDSLQVRMIHDKPFTLRPTVKLWWAMNQLPGVADTSQGFWRRIKLIPFLADFEGRDRHRRVPDLKEKLDTELAGIFNWAMEGLRRLRAVGSFTEVSSVEALTEKYRLESNDVLAFLTDCCQFDPSYNASSSALYAAFQQWARDNGFHPPKSQKVRYELERLKFFPARRAQGIVVHGLRLKGQPNFI